MLFLHGAGERGNNVDSIKKHGIPKRIEEGAHFPFMLTPQCRDKYGGLIGKILIFLKN